MQVLNFILQSIDLVVERVYQTLVVRVVLNWALARSVVSLMTGVKKLLLV